MRLRTLPALLVLSATALGAQPIDSLTIAGLKWRAIGPANSMGRTSDVVGIPSPSKTVYIAPAAAGVWKSVNNGVTWRPLFDDKRVVSMGALAIAPSDTQQVWAGTGEQNTRHPIEPGGGVYKSTDGGLTWILMGLEKTRHIGRIVVHPTNPNIVYVAALGSAWGPNAERGLYTTTDGGRTWELSKFISDKAGFVDVAMDPRNPAVLYAASYERVRTPYSMTSGGPGSALWKSVDDGRTWSEIRGDGFPEGMKGRIGIAIAPSNGDVIYAMVEAGRPRADGRLVPEDPAPFKGLYRSGDAGRTWTRVNPYNDRPFYYSQVRVDPRNENRVYFSSTPLQVSDDGGRTSRAAALGVHVDNHGQWIDPNDPERWVLTHDGGVSITFDRGGNFFTPASLPLTQFYGVSYDLSVPYNVCGGAQDNNNWCGPSRRRSGGITNADWVELGGGDAMNALPDPTDPSTVYSVSYGANITRINLRTNERVALRKPVWQDRYLWWEDSIAMLRGDPLAAATATVTRSIASLREKQRADSLDLAIRYPYTTMAFLSPHDPSTLYVGGSRVLKYTNRGNAYTIVSPNLSKQLTAKIDTAMQWSGGVSLEVTLTEQYGTVVSLAESPVKRGLLYAGTDDGNVWTSANDGRTWTNLTGRFPGLPERDNPFVSEIEASRFDTLTFYVAFNNYRSNDTKPYLYATHDGGRTFTSIASTLPSDGPADYVHVVREDPHNRNLLFAGTSIAAYASIDRGRTWTRFMTGMPSAPFYDLRIHPRDRELIAGTHGRSIWIVDVAPLEQLTPAVATSEAHLFAPAPAHMYGEPVQRGGPSDGQYFFEIASAPYGARISYRLPAGAAAGTTQLEIRSAAGAQVATVQGPGGAGLHTVHWNFAARRGTPPRLRASEVRDSILKAQRAPHVLDSLARAGFDSVAIARARLLLGLAGGGGVARGGGGRGVAPRNPPQCERPMTQWDPFCARPAEGGVQPPRAALGGPFTNPLRAWGVESDNVVRIIELIGVSILNTDARGRGGIGAPTPLTGVETYTVEPGNYTVVLNVGGRTLRQALAVRREGVAR